MNGSSLTVGMCAHLFTKGMPEDLTVLTDWTAEASAKGLLNM